MYDLKKKNHIYVYHSGIVRNQWNAKIIPKKKRLNIKKEYQRKSKKMCFIGISY